MEVGSIPKMFALVLFDIDGCTSIVDVKKFQTPNATDLTKGQQLSQHQVSETDA